MKYRYREKEATALLKEIESLARKTSLPELSCKVESAALKTDGVCNLEYSRIVNKNEMKEQIDIEFDDNTNIIYCYINGYFTLDMI